jgi:hypothetical protein
MDAPTQRNLGLGLMIGGALSMAGALVVAGYARTTMTPDTVAANLLLMREAWGCVAAAGVALLAGTLVLERYRRAREGSASA